MTRLFIALFASVLLTANAQAADLPAAGQVGMTAYTKGHLIDDFLHCASYNRIAAECSAADPALNQRYTAAASKAAESAIKLALAVGITPDQFRPKLNEIDGRMRAQVNNGVGSGAGGNCQSPVLAQQYAIMCRDLDADAGPRTVYWAERYQAERKAGNE